MSFRKRRESKKLEKEKVLGDLIYQAGSQLLQTCKFQNESQYWDLVFDYGMRMLQMKKKEKLFIELEERDLITIVENIAPLLNRYATFNSQLNKFVIVYSR